MDKPSRYKTVSTTLITMKVITAAAISSAGVLDFMSLIGNPPVIEIRSMLLLA